jgi:radical SAM protein with 4Fe4S-binding SPASM domain
MNINWETFSSELSLDSEQKIIVRYLLNRLKEKFADECEFETDECNPSPIEYIADLKLRDPSLDSGVLENRLIRYLSENSKIGTDLIYLKVIQAHDLVTKDEITRLLSENQLKKFAELNIQSMLDIDTGYIPLDERVRAQMEKNRKVENAGIFCSIPFEFAYIDDSGDVYPCCPSKFRLSIGNLRDTSLKEIWHSKMALSVRRSILSGTFKYCDHDACEYLSVKRTGIPPSANNDAVSAAESYLTSTDSSPKIINLAYDRTCNLACPYCRNSRYLESGNNKKSRRIHESIFQEHLKDVKRFIIAGNGDPFASRLYLDMLQNFDSRQYPDVKFKIQTNGLLLTPENWEKISASHDAIDWISVSIDAASEETYKLNRGGSFSKLLENLEFISKLRKENKIKLFFINFVVQANNFREMKQFIQLGLKLKCDLIEFQCIENWGTHSDDHFREIAVQDPGHPDHGEFLEMLEDPIFENPAVCLNKLLEFVPEGLRRKWSDKAKVIKYETFF